MIRCMLEVERIGESVPLSIVYTSQYLHVWEGHMTGMHYYKGLVS